MFGGTLGGVAAATLGLGRQLQPAHARRPARWWGSAARPGMLLGAIVARRRAGAVAGPQRDRRQHGASAPFNSWLVWPSLGLLRRGQLPPPVARGGAIVRSFRHLAALGRRPPAETAPRRRRRRAPAVGAPARRERRRHPARRLVGLRHEPAGHAAGAGAGAGPRQRLGARAPARPTSAPAARSAPLSPDRALEPRHRRAA